MSENVTPRQNLALVALLAGENIDQAARAANVAPRTLQRWMKEDAFRAAVDLAQNDMTRAAVRKLAVLLTSCVDELERLLRTANMSTAEKIKVITLVMNAWPRMNEAVFIDERISELENLLR